MYPIDIEPNAIAWIAGMESICRVSRFFCKADEERREAVPLRMPKRP